MAPEQKEPLAVVAAVVAAEVAAEVAAVADIRNKISSQCFCKYLIQ